MFNSIWAFSSAIVSFIIAAVLGKVLIPFLRKLKFGQTILDIGPNWHKTKQGTPTMGGIMFIISVVITVVAAFVVFLFWFSDDIADNESLRRQTVFIFAGLGVAIINGLIGLIDDYKKITKKQNKGLTAVQKLVLQFSSAICYVAVLAFNGYTTSTKIPFVGEIDIGFFYYVIAVVVIVGIINAVNLNDGIDGLCGSLMFFAAICLMLISSFLHYTGFVILSAALAGGCLGFLAWNFFPAKVFMGDTGSLFLGGILCGGAFATGYPILLLPLGIVFLGEMFSVVLQVCYFKLTKGKRLFKMSPIHHHFEMCGWSEVKIVAVFCAVEIIFGAMAVAAIMLAG